MSELGEKIVRLLELCEGPCDLSLMTQTFSRYDSQEIAETVLDLCLRGIAVADASGIGLASASTKQDDAFLPSDAVIGNGAGFEGEARGIAGSADWVDAVPNGQGNPKGGKAPLFAFDSIDELSLSARPGNALRAAGVLTIAQLVGLLASLTEIPHLGGSSLAEVRASLKERALGFSGALSRTQVKALMDISGSNQYVFDPFGTLCLVDGAWFDGCDVSDLETTPIEALDVSEPIIRRLKSHGLHTVGEVTVLDESQLLSLRGIGASKVDEIKHALRALSCKGDAALRSDVFKRKAFDRPAYLAAFSCEMKALSLALQRKCVECSYPVHEAPFEVCVLPFIQEGFAAGTSEDDLAASAMEALESSAHLKGYCAGSLIAASNRVAQKAEGSPFKDRVRVPFGYAWEQAALELSRSQEGLVYDQSDNALFMKYPSVLDWIETLPVGKREIVRMRFSGRTLEACGNELGVTRERVRQIVKSALQKRPVLSEDRYRSLFDTYDFSEKEFCEISKQPLEVYRYLEEVSPVNKASKLPLEEALEDGTVPPETKEAIRDVIFRTEFVCDDGVSVRTDRRSIIEHLLKRYASDAELSLEQLLHLYDTFLADHEITAKEWRGEESRALKAYLERCDFVMKAGVPGGSAGRDGIRYYNAKAKEFSSLERFLSSGRYRDIECSTALFLDDSDMRKIMDDLDIRNEYELHYAIGRFCPPVEGVTLGRTPIIRFGNATRNDQILSLIKEMGPVDAYALADEYERRYGVKNATFRGSFLKGLEPFCKEGRYVLENDELREEERGFLSSALESMGDYFAVRLLEERFERRFPGRSSVLLSEDALEPYGYTLSSSLCMRSGIDEIAFFADLIASYEEFTVDDIAFGPEVFNNDAFRAELEKAKRTFELIEIEKGRYVKLSRLTEMKSDISSEDIRSYLNEALDFMKPNVPYTVKKMRSEGFCHRLDELEGAGCGTFFYESILCMGYVGSRLKRTSIGNVAVVCKTRQPFSTTTFIEYVVKTQRVYDIADIARYLQSEYGVDMGKPLLRSIVKRSQLHFDDQNDRVFIEA